MAETFAYVGNADSNDISVFKLAESGEMTLLQTAAFTGVDKPGSSTPLAITPDHRVLIAGVRSQPFHAVSFAIDPKTGQLSHIGNGPLADSMANIAIDRGGKVLFSASYGGNKVALNPLQANGVVGRAEAGDPDRAERARLPALARQPLRVRDQSRLRPGAGLRLRCHGGHADAERSAGPSRCRRNPDRGTSCSIPTASSSISSTS